MYFPANGGDAAGAGMTFQRLPACSGCSPGRCVLPNNTAPSEWCDSVPFDPEGLVSSLTATANTFIGAHAGLVFLLFAQHKQRLVHWFTLSVPMLIFACILWSLSTGAMSVPRWPSTTEKQHRTVYLCISRRRAVHSKVMDFQSKIQHLFYTR